MAASPSRLRLLEHGLPKIQTVGSFQSLGALDECCFRTRWRGLYHWLYRGTSSWLCFWIPKNSGEKQALGRSCGGFSTKIHARVDALGNPLQFILTGGQSHDVLQAEALTINERNKIIIADKGYDCDAFISFLKKGDCVPIIPARRQRQVRRAYDLHIYKERHLIECFFSKLKPFRRVFSRFEKTATSFLAFLCFASTLIWLR